MLANLGYLAALGSAQVAASERVAADAMSTVLGPWAGNLIAAVIIVAMLSAVLSLTITMEPGGVECPQQQDHTRRVALHVHRVAAQPLDVGGEELVRTELARRRERLPVVPARPQRVRQVGPRLLGGDGDCPRRGRHPRHEGEGGDAQARGEDGQGDDEHGADGHGRRRARTGTEAETAVERDDAEVQVGPESHEATDHRDDRDSHGEQAHGTCLAGGCARHRA